jgi:8-oxo-dGTP diphosphatase
VAGELAADAALVRAAGGVVWQPGPEVLVLLVHRPKYDDWSLPKGKAERGETDEQTALREVEEETGLRCTLERELPSTSYVDSGGRPKVVRYWAMRPVGSGAQAHAQNEVDEVRWLTMPAASELLSYDRDRAVLDAFALDVGREQA